MAKNEKVTITFTYRTIIRVVIVAVITILFFSFLSKIGYVLGLVFTSLFLSIALNPAVSSIAKKLKSKSRVRATGMAYLLVLIIISGFLIIVVPTIVSQSTNFAKNLPDTFQRYTREDSAVIRFVQDNNLEDDISSATTKLRNRYEDISGSVVDTASRIWSLAISTIIILAMTFMMLIEGPQWMKFFWSLQDPDDVPKRKKTVSKMYRVVTGYVNGQFIIALIAGLAALIGLMIGTAIFGGNINVVVYALIVAVTSLIPMFGATIGAIIVVILCSFTSLPLAIAMAVFFLAYQQIENITIQPLIQSWQSELSPLIVFISALIGIGFGGILGAFVAIPVAACIKIVLYDHYGHTLRNIENKISTSSDKA